MIKISHECPLQLLNDSLSFNDYDYALVHLYDEIPEYKQFYIDAVKNGRTVLLDNSIFELNEAFDADKFAEYVKETKPTEYIVPDVLDNCEGTIESFENFTNKHKLDGVKIGVVQGSTYEEFKTCFQYMYKHADKIAISFNTKCFEEYKLSDDKLMQWCKGRPATINKLFTEVEYGKPLHLLGCSYYSEFIDNKSFYEWINVVSLDTSNPVVAGIKGLKYNERGLNTKPSIKLFELIDTNLSDKQKLDIWYNIFMFRKGLS